MKNKPIYSFMLSLLVLAFFLPAKDCLSSAPKLSTNSEVAIIVDSDNLLPSIIAAPAEKKLILWIANASKHKGVLSIDKGKHGKHKLKNGKLISVIIPSLSSGSYTLHFSSDNGQISHMGTLVIGATDDKLPNEIAIVSAFKKIKPDITHAQADKPLTIHCYATVFPPHGDFKLLKTDITLPLKSKTMQTIKIPDGLVKGVYIISRPGYPKQNHNIKSRLILK